MGTTLLVTLSTVTHFIIPLLLLFGVITGFRKRSSPARILELIGVLVFLCISIASITFAPEIFDSPSKVEVSGYWDRTLTLMFVSSVGFLLFAIGFASDSLSEAHRSEETETHSQGPDDETPPGL